MDCQLPAVKRDTCCPPRKSSFYSMPTIRFFCVICGTALKGNTDSPNGVVECHSCARHVPVPMLAEAPGPAVGCVPAFPPEILAVEVKFLCTSCKSRLGADAHWEGRGVICPVYGDTTRVPRWSGGSQWPLTPESANGTKLPGAVKLSPEEIEFLSQSAPAKPGASK